MNNRPEWILWIIERQADSRGGIKMVVEEIDFISPKIPKSEQERIFKIVIDIIKKSMGNPANNQTRNNIALEVYARTGVTVKFS